MSNKTLISARNRASLPSGAIENGAVRIAKLPKACEMAFTTVTDKFDTSIPYHVMALYNNNFKATIFHHNSEAGMSDWSLSKIIDYGVYTQSPLYTSLRSNPPNYAGFDIAITNIATVNEGRKPTTFSYALGVNDYGGNMYSRMFGGRNSDHQNTEGPKTYINTMQYSNLDRFDLINHASANRWLYYEELGAGGPADADFISGTRAEGFLDYESKVARAIEYQEWLHSFGHWIWSLDDSFEVYLAKMRTEIGANRCFAGTFTQWAEYYYVKKSIYSAKLNGLVITLDYRKDEDRPYDLITTKAWIEVNLVGTALEDTPIQTDVSSEIVKLSANNFAIGVSLDFDLTTLDITLSSEVDETGYNNETIPVVSVDSGTGVITTDQPIRYTLFSKLKAEDEWDAVVEEHEHTISDTLTIGVTINTGTKDYYLGFVNAYSQSGRITF